MTDVTFVLDESGSIGIDDYSKALQAISNTVKNLQIGTADSVGLRKNEKISETVE